MKWSAVALVSVTAVVAPGERSGWDQRRRSASGARYNGNYASTRYLAC